MHQHPGPRNTRGPSYGSVTESGPLPLQDPQALRKSGPGLQCGGTVLVSKACRGFAMLSTSINRVLGCYAVGLEGSLTGGS